MSDKTSIPKLALGVVEPDEAKYLRFKEAKEEELRKKQFRHDWLLACFSSVTGAVFGLGASVIFWLITK